MMQNNTQGWKRFLPSPVVQKILLALVVIGALIAGGFLIANKLEERRIDKEIATQEAIIKKAAEYPDIDKDGAPDWEELLLGFDPQNPDTNGDGKLDGEEIAAIKADTENTELAEQLSNVSETTKLGLAIAGTIENDTSKGITDNETIFANIYRTTDQIMTAKEQQYRPYTDDSFEMAIPGSDPVADFDVYISVSERAVVPVLQKIKGDFPSVVKTKLQPDQSGGEALDAGFAQIIQTAEAKLLAVTVPTPLSDVQLSFLNSLATIRMISEKPVAIDVTERATDLIFLQNAMVDLAETYDTIQSYKNLF